MSQNQENIFRTEFGEKWLFISGLAAITVWLTDRCLELEFKNRCIRVCYFVLTLILYEIGFALFFMTMMHSLGIYQHIIVARIVIVFTVITSVMNTFNHVMLIFHTVCGTGQNHYKLAVKIRTVLYLMSSCSILLVILLRFFSVNSKDIWFVQACLFMICLGHQLLAITGIERKYMMENHPTLYKVSTLPSCLGLLIIPASWIILTVCDRLILEHERSENERHFDVYFFFCLNLLFTLGHTVFLKARYDPLKLYVDTPPPIYAFFHV